MNPLSAVPPKKPPVEAPKKSTSKKKASRARSTAKTKAKKELPQKISPQKGGKKRLSPRRPTRIALFSDVHANYEALQTVLADIRAQDIRKLVCIGDIVGYGAEPSRCLERILKLKCPIVQGNHDRESTSTSDLADYRALARTAMQFTRANLSAAEKKTLKALPMVIKEKAYTVVHSSLVEPEAFFYVDSVQEAAFSFFEQETDVCFIGHTHVAGVYAQTNNGMMIEDWGCPTKLVMEKGNRYLVNVGSVGQPRDRDWRASYVIYTPSKREIEWRRLEYDAETARKKINAAGLPAALGDRILAGV